MVLTEFPMGTYLAMSDLQLRFDNMNLSPYCSGKMGNVDHDDHQTDSDLEDSISEDDLDMYFQNRLSYMQFIK